MVFRQNLCSGCLNMYESRSWAGSARAARWMFTRYQKTSLRPSEWVRCMNGLFCTCQNRKGSVSTWVPSGQIIKIHHRLCTQLKRQGNILSFFKALFYPARLCTKTNWISVNGKKIHPWDGFELNSFAYPTTHEEVGPRDMPSTRDGI